MKPTTCQRIGVFPLLEIPTGSARNGLGNGSLQSLSPALAAKKLGQMDGLWWWRLRHKFRRGSSRLAIPPAACYSGRFCSNAVVGLEIYHRTAQQIGARDDTAFNLGTIIDFNEHHHLLLSAGRSIDGPTAFQSYIAYQFTFDNSWFKVIPAGKPANSEHHLAAQQFPEECDRPGRRNVIC